MTLTIVLPDDAIERIADRAAAITLAQLERKRPASPSPYLTVTEAAEYARCSRQRIYDLLSTRRLRRYRDGARVLVKRVEFDAYLAGAQRRASSVA